MTSYLLGNYIALIAFLASTVCAWCVWRGRAELWHYALFAACVVVAVAAFAHIVTVTPLGL